MAMITGYASFETRSKKSSLHHQASTNCKIAKKSVYKSKKALKIPPK